MFGETEGWILDRNSDGPFTFEAICEALGIEPNSLRDGLRQWRVQQLSGMNLRRLTQLSMVASMRPVAPVRHARQRMRWKKRGVQ
jgi:transposase-like protein